jgi:hypothetical protein
MSDLREIPTTPAQDAFGTGLMDLLANHMTDGLDTQSAIALTGQFLGKLIAMMPIGTSMESLDGVIAANIQIGNNFALKALEPTNDLEPANDTAH